ncbi:MAG: hypothetical protein V1844_17500 [Pseudomonadota bacterium]
MSAHLYIEGSKTGADSKEDQIRCREGFRKLIEKADFAGKMPRLSACGGRGNVFKDFKIAHVKCRVGDYVAMLLDSEDSPADVEKTWDHLSVRDVWEMPERLRQRQVLLQGARCIESHRAQFFAEFCPNGPHFKKEVVTPCPPTPLKKDSKV